jgi:hypothetical protein
MNLREDNDDIVEIGKIKMRKWLMDMTKEDRFKVLREDMSLKGIETLCEWALPEEDYEICASVEAVKANNIDTFKLRFSFEGETSNKALIVKFIGADSRIYYHADYLLHDSDEGALVMLHKNNEGIWTSEWASSEPRLFTPIGVAIEARETK